MAQHALAGQTVTIKSGAYAGSEYRVEDYWKNVSGNSWKTGYGNPAAMNYMTRVELEGLPDDDDVLYGKIGGFGYLVHVSELS